MLHEGEAKVLFGDGEAEVIARGRYVRCAVTGRHIPIEELRYWSVPRQEAYIDAEAALKATRGR
ncbi:DUF2093 domain-containing protein [Oceanibacterium hippocampi]|uniref:DUF2093 domain-containing protein n=1 Tax=Oceanibacterium hippocampi TaxID=745714 RepID=A0A1Y5S9I1_9PROT|nr:DUF2093 domain-containing protein [Oceanibacterium hippocampi]SLN33054.1 hypothetical protein OCH7691_01258 [Oceanibacterium hippocampi]